jgi:tRNA-dihydrouridine synthase
VRQKHEHLGRRLRNGFFLSSMMGVTDGVFCAQRSGGCAMVQLGAYLAEPEATAADIGQDAASYLPADAEACEAFLTQACTDARGGSDVVTCMNLATLALAHGIDAANAFQDAGGDLVELNAHGGVQRYLDRGKLRAAVLPEHQAELFRWVQALAALEIPLIVKVNGESPREAVLQMLTEMSHTAAFGVHVNVRDAATHRPDVGLVAQARERYPGFLLVSGYFRSAEDARAVFEAGADMVGIAAPAIKDAGYIQRIANAYAAPTT